MAKYILILGVLLFAQSNLFSQNISPIDTDRPDQTESPVTLPKHYFQMETGFSFEQTNAETKTFAHPSVLFKYGVTGRFDLRLVTEFITVKNSIEDATGFNPVAVGFKMNIVKEKGILPTTSLLGLLALPRFASKDFIGSRYAPGFRLAMQNTISEKVDLGYNVGAEWDDESGKPEFIYTVTTGYSASEKVSAFVEIFGFAPQYAPAYHSFDCGLTYLIKQNMSADISGGFGITENAPGYFLALGFSFRLPR
ncbi:MAG TPA: transporter [Parafilimonas sp.]|nr:transporter [Parafilimonas sp.]